MFKKLKDQIGESLAGTPARNLLPIGHSRQDGSGRSSSSRNSTPSGSFLDVRSADNAGVFVYSEDSTPPGKDSSSVSRSRTSSVSSQASDLSYVTPLSFVTPSYPGLLDLESSVSEVETDSASVTSLSKDDIYQMYCKVLRTSRLYKTRYLQVATLYKEIEKERDKLKNTLSQSQDKSLKRISELREQLELERLAKVDLENNFTLSLDEKDELVKILQLQISLLKEGKDIPEELKSKSEEIVSNSQPPVVTTQDSSSNVDSNSNITLDTTALRDKVKRLESLLNKCKETIKMNKDRVFQLTTDRESIAQQLKEKSEELDRVKVESQSNVAKFKDQLKQARQIIEDLESEKVTLETTLHRTSEEKDLQLLEVKQNLVTFGTENADLKIQVQKLSKTGEQEREKFRGVIRRLEEEKLELEEETKHQLEKSEQTLEKEKDSELQELRRGKVEALQVLQKQMQDRTIEMEKEKELVLEERDKQWKEKILQMDQSKHKEFEQTLAEKLDEMSLEVEEQQLQKMAAVKQCDLAASDIREQCNRLSQEKRELEIKLENLRLETSEEIRSLKDEVTNINVSNDSKLKELRSKHESEKSDALENRATKHHKQLEEMRAEYVLKVGELRSIHEQKVEERVSEVETTYEAMISNMTALKEVGNEDTRLTLVRIQNEAKETTEQKKALEEQVSELRKELEAEREATRKSSSQVEELQEKFQKENESFQSRLRDLIARIDHGETNYATVADENLCLKMELIETRKNSEGMISSLMTEVKRLQKDGTESVTSVQSRNNSEKDDIGVIDGDDTAQDGHRDMDENNGIIDRSVGVMDKGHGVIDGGQVVIDEGCGVVDGGQRNTVTDYSMSADGTDRADMTDCAADYYRQELQKCQAEMAARATEYVRQVASASETARHLEERINDLIERENHLNVELEQSKNENERNLAVHDSEMRSLRQMIECLQTSEQALKEQLRATTERCESELSRVSDENVSAMGQFSGILTEGRLQMEEMLRDLMETQMKSNRIVSSLESELDEKCAQLDYAYRRIEELGGEACETSARELLMSAVAGVSEDGKEVLMEDNAEEGNIRLLPLPASVESSQNILCQQINVDVNSTSSANVNDDDAPNELHQKICELEKSLEVKDRRISWFESKVKDFGTQIQNETTEMRQRSRRVELMIEDKDQLLREKDELITIRSLTIASLEKKVHELESVLAGKTSNFEDLQKTFWQLQSEAKTRITSLKIRLLEKEKEGVGTEPSYVPERVKQLEEEFAAEKAEMVRQHEAMVNQMKESLEAERQNMILFQENVKKQFVEKQEKVKFVIERLKENCEQSLLDRDHLYEIKLLNLEREKNLEKEQAIRDLTATVAKLTDGQEIAVTDAVNSHLEEINFLKAELESAKVRHCEVVSRYQSEREALFKHSGEEGSEQMRERLKRLEKKNVEQKSIHDNEEATEPSEMKQQLSDDVENRSLLETDVDQTKEENKLLKERIVELENRCSALLAEIDERRQENFQENVVVQTFLTGEDLLKMESNTSGSGDAFHEMQMQEDEERIKNNELEEELERTRKKMGILAERVELEVRERMEILDRQKEEEMKMKADESTLLEEIEKLKELYKLRGDEIDELKEKFKQQQLDKETETEEMKMQQSTKETKIEEMKMEQSTKETKIEEMKMEWSMKDIEMRNQLVAKEMEKEKLESDFKIFKDEHISEISKLRELQLLTSENHETQVKHLTEDNEMKCHKLAEMEKSDLDLQVALKELSEKLNGVTENALQLERTAGDYRKQLEVEGKVIEVLKGQLESQNQTINEKELELSEERERLGEMEVKKLLETEMKLKEYQETIERLETKQRCVAEEWEKKLELLREEYEQKEEMIPSSQDRNSGGGDLPFAVDLREQDFVVDLNQRASNSRLEDQRKSFEEEIGLKECRENTLVERLRAEFKANQQTAEDEHNCKVIQLVKEFNVQMTETEQQITASFEDEIETLRKSQSRLLSDHREQMRDLNEQLNDRSSLLEDTVNNYEAQIQSTDERHKNHIENLNKIIEELQQSLLDKEWMTSRETVQHKEEEIRTKTQTKEDSELIDDSEAELILRKQLIELEAELDDIKLKHSIELYNLSRRLEQYENAPLSPLIPSLGHQNSVLALGGEDVYKILELQNSNLQMEVNVQLNENAKLKSREKELVREHELRMMCSSSSYINSMSSNGPMITEATEMEYLKNILYKYMIGMETKTLAKVICTVVKFSDDQTKTILEKEETRNSKIFSPVPR